MFSFPEYLVFVIFFFIYLVIFAFFSISVFFPSIIITAACYMCYACCIAVRAVSLWCSSQVSAGCDDVHVAYYP